MEPYLSEVCVYVVYFSWTLQLFVFIYLIQNVFYIEQPRSSDLICHPSVYTFVHH